MCFNWLKLYLANSTSSIRNSFEEALKIEAQYTQFREKFPSIQDILWVINKAQYWLNPQTLYCEFKSTTAEALEHIVIACLVYLLVCLGIYKLTFWLSVNNKNNNNNEAVLVDGGGGCGKTILQYVTLRNVHLPKHAHTGRVLFIIAHPDDECMFFGPLIYSLTQRNDCQVYVLCLSNGNYENLGERRREELWSACQALGINAANIILVNATNLPDDPNVEWRTETVANLILHTIESLDIQAIFTFDRDGVSSHPNHCAVYYAAASLCLANLLPKACKFYTLDSINIVRKYLSIFDLLCTCFMSTHWCILNWQQASIIRRAMLEHKSQMKWFRWIYIYFSRYIFINSLREINLSDVELEMQIHDH